MLLAKVKCIFDHSELNQLTIRSVDAKISEI